MNMRRILPVLLLLITVVACLAQRPTAGEARSTIPQDDASELALLMRTMASHTDSVKAALKRDAKLPPKPDVSRLLTATPTEGMHIDPITYPTFSADYVKNLDALYKAPKKERPKAYNALVQSCANCHGVHCPGPLMRIKKMYVDLEE
jgi:cytochrome c553